MREREREQQKEKETEIMMRLDGRSEESCANNSNYGFLQYELQKLMAFMRIAKGLWQLQSTMS